MSDALEDGYTYAEVFEAATTVFKRLSEADLLERTPEIEALEDAHSEWIMKRIAAKRR